MGLVTRSTKQGGQTSYADGQILPATDLETDAATLFGLVNGNIDTNNASLSAGFKGSQLADAPNGVSVNKINDGAVTTAKLADANVTLAKMAAAAITAPKLKTVDLSNPGLLTSSGGVVSWNTAISVTNTIPLCIYKLTASGTGYVIYQSGGTWWINWLQNTNIPIGDLHMIYATAS